MGLQGLNTEGPPSLSLQQAPATGVSCFRPAPWGEGGVGVGAGELTAAVMPSLGFPGPQKGCLSLPRGSLREGCERAPASSPSLWGRGCKFGGPAGEGEVPGA